GLTGARLNGTAQARVDIAFPTFHDISNANFGLTFAADVRHGNFKQAALGWDLTDASLRVTGDLLADTLDISGPAQLGPYQGNISYRTQLEPKTQLIDFDGHFNAAQFGGSPKVPVAISGHFTTSDRQGQGTVTSDIFNGDVKWKGNPEGDEERPTDLIIEGVTRSEGMEDQGLPIFERLKREIPTRISLLRSGDIWSGELEAESLSGEIAFVQGTRPRLVYKSIITPDEADELGYGGLPMFNVPRHLTVNISLDGQSKEALINLDQMNAVLGWTDVPGSDELLRRLDMKVTPEDWYMLGLPKAFFTPPAPVDVTALWQQTGKFLKGHVQWPGQNVEFDMPLKSRGGPPPIQLPNTANPYQLQVRTTLNDAALATLGYSQAPVRIQGDVGLVFSLYDMPGQPMAVLNLDASRAELGIKSTNWIKPVDEQALVAISFDSQKPNGSSEDAGVNLSRIYAQGARVGIEGRAAFSSLGELEFADFSRLYLKDFADLALKYYIVPESSDATRNTRVISLSGRTLDLRPWLDAAKDNTVKTLTKVVEPITDDVPGQFMTHLVVDLDHLQMANDGAFNALKLDLNWNGHNGLSGTGHVVSLGGGDLSLTMRDEDEYSLFTMKTGNLGDIIDTATANHNVKSGRAVLDGVYANGQIDAALRGNNIRVKQIPILAQLLTVASLQGLNDTLIGDGILFNDFEFPVRYHDNLLFIKDGWARGGAMGINVWGTSDLNSKKLDMNGSLIPAYRINSIFGDLKSNGLGLVGLKYDLRGTLKEPQVTVNPLSVVLPGFIKAWADSSRVDAMPALDLPGLEDRLDSLRDDNDKSLKK
ncbi:MAG: AsmA-like C-terminal region-containing protein, partial [Asticcacaulis sp.]